QPDVAGNVDVRLGAAAMRSAQHFLEMQRQRIDRDVVPFFRHAHQDGLAIRMCQVVGELDHAGPSGRVHYDVGAGWTDDLANALCQIARRAVEAMRGAEPPRPLELRADEVDGYERVSHDHRSRPDNGDSD